MNSKFKITIPKPCHENWNTMTPKDKGRFCSSCSKTVVDFTKKSTTEIQDYLVKNKSQSICGHFNKKQLDAITIEIPRVTFQQQLSFQKVFILALFFVMGTTLFSCQYTNGKKQKIQDVILVDNLEKIDEKIDHLKTKKDSIIITKKTVVPPVPPSIANLGLTIIPNNLKKDSIIEITTVKDLPIQEEVIFTGKIEPPVNIINPDNIIDITTIENIEEVTIEGDISYEEVEEDFVLGFIIQEPPRFKSSKKISNEKARKNFDDQMKNFVDKNFNKKTTQCLNLSEGKHKIFTQFIINKKGLVTDIKVKAPHPILKKEVREMLQKLPQFIPGKQGNKTVKTKYNLPIIFMVE